MLCIADCPLRCSLNKGSCRRSSDATVLRSQIVHCVCNQGPQLMSRPGPKSGTRSSKCSRFFDQNNSCSLWCEGGRPSRKVHGKRPTRYAVNISRAEALRWKQLQRCAVPIQLCWTVHPVCLSWSTRFSCAPHSGHMTFLFFKLVVMHCRLVLQTGVADCSATMFLTGIALDDCQWVSIFYTWPSRPSGRPALHKV